MYRTPDIPPWTPPSPARPQGPVPGARALGLHLALLLFPLTAGVLTGAAVPLVLAFHPGAGWHVIGGTTLAALLLAAPTAHLLALRLLGRTSRGQGHHSRD